jgi:hypothetical protein
MAKGTADVRPTQRRNGAIQVALNGRKRAAIDHELGSREVGGGG